MLKLKDLLGEPEDEWNYTLFTGTIVAKNSFTGEEVFDTHKDRSEYVKKFFLCEITGIHCGMDSVKLNNTATWIPVLMIYLKGDEVHECKRQNS